MPDREAVMCSECERLIKSVMKVAASEQPDHVKLAIIKSEARVSESNNQRGFYYGVSPGRV